MTTDNPRATPPTDRPDGQPVNPPLRYRGRRLDGPIDQFHAAVDALEADTVPETYYQRVLAGREGSARER